MLSLGAQPLQHRLQLGKAEIEQRVVDLVKFPDELGRALAAAEALLELVQTVGFVQDEHTAKVVNLRAVLVSPADHLCLHGIVWHQVALVVRAGAVDIPGLVAVVDADGAGEGLPFVLGNVDAQQVAAVVGLQHPLEVVVRAVADLVAHRGDLVQLIELAQVFPRDCYATGSIIRQPA